jgi:hypothetical protein
MHSGRPDCRCRPGSPYRHFPLARSSAIYHAEGRRLVAAAASQIRRPCSVRSDAPVTAERPPTVVSSEAPCGSCSQRTHPAACPAAAPTASTQCGRFSTPEHDREVPRPSPHHPRPAPKRHRSLPHARICDSFRRRQRRRRDCCSYSSHEGSGSQELAPRQATHHKSAFSVNMRLHDL